MRTTIQFGVLTLLWLAACTTVTANGDNRSARMIEGGGGLPIAVTEAGSPGTKGIIFLHSLISSSQVWEKQLGSALLTDTFRLIAMDLRGHGSSAKPYNAYLYRASRPWGDDLAAVISESGLSRPIVVASGYGGLVALDYIRHHGSDSLSGLVLVGTTAGLLPPPPSPEETPERLARIERSRSVDQRVILDWTKGFLNFLVGQGPLPADEIERLTVSAMLVPHYVRRFVRGRPTDNTDLVGQLDVPLMFAVGAKDPSVKVEDVRRVQQATGGEAGLEIFENGGPIFFWYEPDRFNRSLKTFALSQIDR